MPQFYSTVNAVVDILGFSNTVRETPLLHLVMDYITNFCNGLLIESENTPDFYILSDSFILIPRNDKGFLNSVQTMVHALGLMIHNSILLTDRQTDYRQLIPGMQMSEKDIVFPLRGAISFGESCIITGKIIHDIILGDGISKSNEWEKSQEWLGVSFNMDTVTKDIVKLLELLEKLNYIIKWDVETKRGIVNTYAVNFVVERHSKIIVDNIKKLINYYQDEKIIRKYTNTLDFIEFIIAEKRFPPLNRFVPIKPDIIAL